MEICTTMTKLLTQTKRSIGKECWRCCFWSVRSALILSCLLVFLAPLLPSIPAIAQERARVESEIMLQGFNWESAVRPGGGWYNVVNSLSREIKDAGFTSVWLPPPSEAVPSPDQPPVPGVVDSRGYMPLRYYNLNSMYGSVYELRNLLASLRSQGVSPIADIVINHRAAMNRDNYGRWNVFDAPVWGTWAIVREHVELGATGGPDSGVVYPFAADLDHANTTVRRDLTEWMLWLKNEVGFTGWRYDFSKGYSGTFVGEYNSATRPGFSVGEYWTELDYSCFGGLACYDQDRHRQRIVDWIDSTWENSGRGPEFASAAFDFTTKGILQYAIRTGEFWRLRDSLSRAPGLIGLWPAKSVTFIDNHDTGSTQRHWVFGDFDQVRKGYAYILTHPGVPTVFWDHYFDWGMKQDIKALMAIRRRNGIRSTSSLVIEAAQKDLYAATIDGRVAVKIGSGDWSPERTQRAPWRLTYSGNNFAVWEH
jgi:alpha-amylase